MSEQPKFGTEGASGTELTQSPEREDHFDYQILRGQTNRREDEGETDESFRARYLNLTDQLINKIEQAQIDVVVYLDKSARPVQWLVNEFWDDLAVDENGQPKPKPESKFVNIDREQWEDVVGRPDTGSIDVSAINQRYIDELRGIFVDPNNPQKTLFEGKRVMVVDELRTTGATLEIAKEIFVRAFPEATDISSAWWMRPQEVTKPRQGKSLAEEPVWYNRKIASGRGVDNRDPGYSVISPSRTQRMGPTFLSTPYHRDNPDYNPNIPTGPGNKRYELIDDPRSNQLRAEVEQLGRDVREGKQYVIPTVRDYEFYQSKFKLRQLPKR